MRIPLLLCLLCLLALGGPALAQNTPAPQRDSKPFPMRVEKADKKADKKARKKSEKKKPEKKFEKTEKTQASIGK